MDEVKRPDSAGNVLSGSGPNGPSLGPGALGQPERPINPLTGKPKHAGGRPPKAGQKPLAFGGEGEPVRVADDGRIVLEELRKEGLGNEIPKDLSNMAEFSKEEMQELLSLGFITVSNGVLALLKRQKVSLEEADRWGKCTRIVYWKWLQHAQAGMLVHGLLTLGIFMNKPLTPEGAALKAERDKANGKNTGKP